MVKNVSSCQKEIAHVLDLDEERGGSEAFESSLAAFASFEVFFYERVLQSDL